MRLQKRTIALVAYVIVAFFLPGGLGTNTNRTYLSIQTSLDTLNSNISLDRRLQTNSSLVRICLLEKRRYVTKSIPQSELQATIIKKGVYLGTCNVTRCRALCKHKPCNDDYRVTSGGGAGPICQCKRRKFLCGSGASCVNDQCQCNMGSIGNPLTNCTQNATEILDEFCWKSSYDRGVGRLQDSCPPGQEQRGFNCYSQCPTGYTSFLLDCVQVCPSGWRDDGIGCYLLGEYWRGFGFALWDQAGCERSYGKGNCELWLVNWHQKCKPGFVGLSENCFPTPPNCVGLGFSGGIGLLCTKSVIPGVPKPFVCAAGLQLESTGLCYQPCTSGYAGVLFLCWEIAPQGWVDCSFGSARDSASCTRVLQNQLMAVINIAQFFIGLVVDAIVKLSAEWVEITNQFAQFQGVIIIFFAYNGGGAIIIAWKATNGGYTPEEIKAMDPTNEPVDKMKLIVDSFAELYKTFNNKPCSQLQL